MNKVKWSTKNRTTGPAPTPLDKARKLGQYVGADHHPISADLDVVQLAGLAESAYGPLLVTFPSHLVILVGYPTNASHAVTMLQSSVL